jgi:hypothetical protein
VPLVTRPDDDAGDSLQLQNGSDRERRHGDTEFVGHGPEPLDPVETWADDVRREVLVVVADVSLAAAPVVRFEPRLACDGAGQQPECQRRVPEIDDALFGEPGEEPFAVSQLEQRQAVLHRVDMTDREASFDEPAVEVRHADVSGEAFVGELGEGAPRLFDGDLVLGRPVDLVQVDPVGAEPPQRAEDRSTDVFWSQARSEGAPPS